LGNSFNWLINPDTGYKYDVNKHFSKINDFSKEAGDIKYIWEKARFTFLYDLIRYDYHFNENQSAIVFNEIVDFIDKIPINQGPNYKCSQEISLRILNWTFALNYYKKSDFLTDDRFQKIINAIYWQLHHVYQNINFSRIAVRNNHAITETAMLYLSNFLFPFIPETQKWSTKGKKWLLKELQYQIYDDGSYLQFSHNYHRVIVQTLTWVLQFNRLNEIKFDYKIIDRIERTVDFLYQLQDSRTGWLPNHGNNDGALFFPLNNNHYRDYRPQLQALGTLLGKQLYDEIFEDSFWFGIQESIIESVIQNKSTLISYKHGGFYGFRDEALTTIRCGSYKDRPAQADALHLDIWFNGMNILFDPGTYKYITSDDLVNFYFGTQGHNTLVIGNYNQMLKGNRFIWFYWTKKAQGQVVEFDDRFEFEGKIFGFPNAGKHIYHQRKVIKWKNIAKWEIIDKTNYIGTDPVLVKWNVLESYKEKIKVTSFDIHNQETVVNAITGWYSECYGVKEKTTQLLSTVNEGYCKTIITLK
jgi:hypothetical protein